MSTRGRTAAVLLLSVVLGLVFGLPVAGARAAPREPVCKPRHAQVLARHGAVIVFRRRTGPAGEYGEPSALYACARTRGRPVRLASFQEGELPEFDHLAGANPIFSGGYVAFAYKFLEPVCGKYTGGGPQCEVFEVASVNLRTGRARASAVGSASALVLTPLGWIAWVSSSGELEGIGSHGETVLDGGGVEAASLHASGQKITWTSAGVAHEAALE